MGRCGGAPPVGYSAVLCRSRPLIAMNPYPIKGFILRRTPGLPLAKPDGVQNDEYRMGDLPRAVEHGGNLEPELRVVADDVLCSTLSHRGLIVVRGPDADQPLQGQLTCDVREATLKRSLLGAYCSPKGRALACFRLFRRNDGLYLELPRDLVSPTLARLSNMYCAKVTLEDASDHLVCLGIAGPTLLRWRWNDWTKSQKR